MIFFEKLKKYDIILASKSPRREYLLKELQIPFRVATKSISEPFNESLAPEQIVLQLCRSKACAYSETLTNPLSLLITADTIVYVDGQVLNKPSNKQEAAGMLGVLSGNTHAVYTGVCLKTQDKEEAFYEKTSVEFEKLTSDEIDFYLENFKTYDKAGGYGIQEWIGLVAIRSIEGSYHNIVGLPVARLFKELKSFIE